MGEITSIGLDLGKYVFQVHGADASGAKLLNKRLRRKEVRAFFSSLSPRQVGLEACGGAHHWGRVISAMGHEVRLIPPAYVKPFVKRQKNDAADAEAICEALGRPNMRFVAIKPDEQQASALTFRARDLLVRQHTQIINAIRSHLSEFGIVAPIGILNVGRLVEIAYASESDLPDTARPVIDLMIDTLQALSDQISVLDAEIAVRATSDPDAKRLQTIPGVGAVTATAVMALAPPMVSFRKGRDFAAWVGLTPFQKSTGGKQILGRTSKMGDKTLRRLLVIGASAVVRWAARKGAPAGSWLEGMMS